MVREGYRQPEPRTDMIALGEPSLAVLKLGVHLMLRGGHISEYDAHIGTRLARILTGGRSLARPESPNSTFLISSGRRFCPCWENRKRRNASGTCSIPASRCATDQDRPVGATVRSPVSSLIAGPGRGRPDGRPYEKLRTRPEGLEKDTCKKP